MSSERDHDKPVAVLALVRPTQFEAMAANIGADNKKRDHQIGLLETIMTA